MIDIHVKKLLTHGQITLFTDIGSRYVLEAKEFLKNYSLTFSEYVLTVSPLDLQIHLALKKYTGQELVPYMFFGDKFVNLNEFHYFKENLNAFDKFLKEQKIYRNDDFYQGMV